MMLAIVGDIRMMIMMMNHAIFSGDRVFVADVTYSRIRTLQLAFNVRLSIHRNDDVR